MTLQCSFEPRTTTLMVGNLFAQVGHPYHIIHGFEIGSKDVAALLSVE
jgi:hypothetical protein